ncbi:22622_t:CDS:2 [Gigaspora rosea]|nr:22622_t:CDS:2 [Gigaspora rosea]
MKDENGSESWNIQPPFVRSLLGKLFKFCGFTVTSYGNSHSKLNHFKVSTAKVSDNNTTDVVDDSNTFRK